MIMAHKMWSSILSSLRQKAFFYLGRQAPELIETCLAFVTVFFIWLRIESSVCSLMAVLAARLSLLFFFYVCLFDAYYHWKKHISKRKARWQDGSPSRFSRPRLKQRKIIQNDQLSLKNESLNQTTSLPKDWDHQYMSLCDFIWARIFVFLPLMFHMFFGSFPGSLTSSQGMLRYCVKSLLGRCGFLKMQFNYKECFAAVFLNTSCILFATHESVAEVSQITRNNLVNPGSDLRKPVLSFHFTHLLSLTSKGNGDQQEHKYGSFKGTIDMTIQTLIVATYDNEEVSPVDALLLLFFNIVYPLHTKVHAYSNWSVNFDASDWCLHRMSLIAAYYNHLGCHGFGNLQGFLNSIGIIRSTQAMHIFLSADPMPFNVPPHGFLVQLCPLCPHVHFVAKVRDFFLSEIRNHKDDFVGIDPEALFIGSVIHSLDHANIGTYLDDFAINYRDNNFRPMWEIASLARTCFNSRNTIALPINDVCFKTSPHPFFRRVYEFAKTIDTDLANELEYAIF